MQDQLFINFWIMAYENGLDPRWVGEQFDDPVPRHTVYYHAKRLRKNGVYLPELTNGHRLGGQRTAERLKANDPDFYAKIGAIGGVKGKTGGFASDKVGLDGLNGKQRASVAGAIGGALSRRGRVKKESQHDLGKTK